MKPKSLRKHLTLILGCSSALSLLCTLLIAITFIILSRSESLDKIAIEIQKTAENATPKLVSGLLLFDESAGLGLHIARIKEAGKFDEVTLEKNWDVSQVSDDYTRCVENKFNVTCISQYNGSVLVATPIKLSEKILGWLLIGKVDRGIFSISKLWLPLFALLIGFSLCIIISMIWTWRFVTRNIEQALLTLSKSIDSNQMESYPQLPDFQIEDLNVISNKMTLVFGKIQEVKVKDAIIQTTQMLAHDVRKPFSMVKALLEMLLREQDAERRSVLMAKHIPSVDIAIKSIDLMIKDVLLFGRKPSQEKENVDFESILEAALNDSKRPTKNKNISINLDLKHKRKISVVPQDVSRALGNVLSNAFEAMPDGNSLFITTTEVAHSGATFLRVEIRNTGSYIPKDVQSFIFEPFYTKGKKSGTGLGLAIAKQMIENQNGVIGVHSDEHMGTTFYFTVPTSRDIPFSNSQISLHSDIQTFPHSVPLPFTPERSMRQ